MYIYMHQYIPVTGPLWSFRVWIASHPFTENNFGGGEGGGYSDHNGYSNV